MLSDRIKNIQESGIRKVFDIASQAGGNFVNLSIGQPHFDIPSRIKDAAKNAINCGLNSYTNTMGLPGLREKIAKKLQNENGLKKADAQNIIITSGVSGGLFLLFSAILDPGDEVIIPDPYFVLYKQILDFLNVKIINLDTYPDFNIDAKKIKNLITPRTKAILLNSPNNPTGAVYNENSLKEIAAIAGADNLIIISDEIYEKFDYENKFFSIGSIYKNTVTLNGFSKSYAATGWRIGYAHGPNEIIQAMSKLQQYTFVCAPSFAQYAFDKEFNILLEEKYNDYKKKRDYVYNLLKDKYELRPGEGAFYFFIKIPDSRPDFLEKLIKNKLLVVPGGVFSKRNDYFRISFAVDDQELKKGVNILLAQA